MGVLGKANIGGVLRDLTGDGYVNIGGVLRPITVGKINIGGVLLAGGYTWKKYNTKSVTTYTENESQVNNVTMFISDIIYAFTGKTFDSKTGKFTLQGRVSLYNYEQVYGQYPYVLQNFAGTMYDVDTVYKATSVTFVTYSSYSVSGYKYTAKSNTTYSQGTYIENVTSPDENAYPENGRHTDGYWYVKQ